MTLHSLRNLHILNKQIFSHLTNDTQLNMNVIDRKEKKKEKYVIDDIIFHSLFHILNINFYIFKRRKRTNYNGQNPRV